MVTLESSWHINTAGHDLRFADNLNKRFELITSTLQDEGQTQGEIVE